MRKLKDLQRQAEELTAEEQIELAQYLLTRAAGRPLSEESMLTEPLLAKDWLRPEEDRAWASL